MRSTTWWVVSIAAALAACGGGGSGGDGTLDGGEPDSWVGHGPVRTVTISNDGVHLAPGETKQFAATAMFDDGTSCDIGSTCGAGFTVTWTASPADRIVIDASGLATIPATASFGTATVTGTVQTPAVAAPDTAARGSAVGTATVTVKGWSFKLDRNGTEIADHGEDFVGNVPGGAPVPFTYRVTNTGTEPLRFSGGVAVITGDACMVTATPPAGDIGPGASATFTIQVMALYGAFSCSILVISSVPQMTFVIAGEAVSGRISLGVSSGDPQGDRSVGVQYLRTLPVKNIGNGPLVVGTAMISNVVNCTASVVTQPTGTLPTAGMTPLVLSIRPTAAGTFHFLVSIPSDDPGLPIYTFMVTGVGVVPEIYVAHPLGSEVPSGSNDPYGNRAAGVAFQVDYDILDTGQGGLSITNTTFTMQNNCTGVVTSQPALFISGNSATGVSVSITPTSPGTFYCVLSMDNDDADENPYTISISGTALTPGSPEIVVKKYGSTPIESGDSFDQGSRAINQEFTAPLTVTNTGTGSLIVDPVEVSSQSNCIATIPLPPPAILDPNQPSPVDVKVTPIAAGPFDCVISLGNNDTTGNENPYVVHITGQGGFSEISVENGSGTTIANGMDDPMGTRRLDVAFPLTYTIRNTGDGPLAITATSFFNQINCNAQVTTPPSPTVAPNGTTTVTISVTPIILGAFECDLSISNNDTTGGESPYLVKVTGTGVAPEIVVETGGPPQFSVSSGGGFFAGNFPKNVPIQVDFTVRNTGTAPLAVGGVTLPAANQTGCTTTVTATPASSVAAMSITTFSISLTPTGGAFSCRVSIANDDSNENPYTIDVRGNGI